ncbi:hypothetical protein P261_00445 [Lachnospiraceae bacterium TWA4]|nr:hypothetical protein P261_00445 [Lachnospiraceae bacterium TWA4]
MSNVFIADDFVSNQNLDALEKMVYIALTSRADAETCELSARELGKIVGLTRPTVIKRLKSLKKKGYISIEKRYSEENGFQKNLYKLL